MRFMDILITKKGSKSPMGLADKTASLNILHRRSLPVAECELGFG